MTGLRFPTLAALLAFAAAPGAFRAEAAQCGTAMLFETDKRPGSPVGGSLRIAGVDNRARTLVSDHFLLHYSLRGLHRVHTGPEDSALVRAADSLYAAFKLLPEAQRDSTVYARLDSAHVAHPVYVRKTEEYFEAARAYYVGALGMSAPVSNTLSVQYNVSAALDAKFPVDIVDVGTADSHFIGETYGVTYPPEQLSVSFENDFICRAKLDAQGRIEGDSIKSRLSGEVIHNYAEEWELGIKVTAFHEFYHAVQFTYVPNVNNYHAWYEISATGMEERNAGEVDDYLQYLPCVLYNHDRLPLTSTFSTPAQGSCSHYPMYGQGIFHQYLSQALDSAFDVQVWERLGRNKDMLQDGLETAFAKYGKSMATLYPGYAAQILFGGRRFPQPAGLFSPDMAKWPDPTLDSVDMTSPSLHKVINLPPLTFSLLKVKWGPGAFTRILQAKTVSGISRIHVDGGGSEVEQLQATQFALGPPHDGFREYYLVLPNPSFTVRATVEIRDPESVFFAFPNPVRAAPAALYFSQAKGMAFPATVRIYSEAGRLIRNLVFPEAGMSLSWDLQDGDGRSVKPGLYYYRLEAQPLKVLLVLR